VDEDVPQSAARGYASEIQGTVPRALATPRSQDHRVALHTAQAHCPARNCFSSSCVEASVVVAMYCFLASALQSHVGPLVKVM